MEGRLGTSADLSTTGKLKIFLLLFSLLISGAVTAQSVQVPGARLKVRGQMGIISYEIPFSTSEHKYTVRALITDPSGKTVDPSALFGDVGEDIPGGQLNVIIWDLKIDRLEESRKISVEIRAELTKTPEKEYEPIEEIGLASTEAYYPGLSEIGQSFGEPEEREPIVMPYDPKKVVLQSLAFPGLGLSKITGKPHWLRGVAAYGCVAGFVYFNFRTAAEFDNYLNATSVQEGKMLFNNAYQQDMISEILAYSAMGVWAIDLIWTLTGLSELKKKAYRKRAALSLSTGFEPEQGAPMLVIKYRF